MPSLSRLPIRVGFVALSDAAPLAAAQHLGLYSAAGIQVELHRELGWASIREKLVFGELDVAHAPAGLPVAITLGLGCIAAPCTVSHVLSRGGNAITISHRWSRTRGQPLFHSRKEPLVFGIVSLYSSHHFFARRWLSAQGLRLDRDVRFVVVPPAQSAPALLEGHLDGFCAGEPWNSLAVEQGAGWIATTEDASTEQHRPEKVLASRGAFAEQRLGELLALTAALLEAAEWCDCPEGRGILSRLLAERAWIDCDERVLRRAFRPTGEGPHPSLRFSGAGLNRPDPAESDRIIAEFHQGGLLTTRDSISARAGCRSLFRSDLHTRAAAMSRPTAAAAGDLRPALLP